MNVSRRYFLGLIASAALVGLTARIVDAKGRSKRWRALERRHLRVEPFCQACGTTDNLQVHHIKPFHDFPALELDPENLITLCMSANECHLRIGHGGSFEYYNPNVRADCTAAAKSKTLAERSVVEDKARVARIL